MVFTRAAPGFEKLFLTICIEYKYCLYDCCKFYVSTILLKLIFIEIFNILLCKSDTEIYDSHTILYFNIVCVIFGQNMKKKNLRNYVSLENIMNYNLFIYMLT